MPISQSDSTTPTIVIMHPACAKCGARTSLARIEPADEPHHDVRTYECTACGNSDTVMVKFR